GYPQKTGGASSSKLETQWLDHNDQPSNLSYKAKLAQMLRKVWWSKNPLRRRTFGYILLVGDLIAFVILTNVFHLKNGEALWGRRLVGATLYGVPVICLFLIVSGWHAGRQNKLTDGREHPEHRAGLTKRTLYWLLRFLVAAYGVFLLLVCLFI